MKNLKRFLNPEHNLDELFNKQYSDFHELLNFDIRDLPKTKRIMLYIKWFFNWERPYKNFKEYFTYKAFHEWQKRLPKK